MKTVGMFEGRVQFSALVADAIAGETIVVTKNGKPVAELGPVRSSLTPAEAMKRLLARKLRIGIPIRELIDEGRR